MGIAVAIYFGKLRAVDHTVVVDSTVRSPAGGSFTVALEFSDKKSSCGKLILSYG